MSLLTELFAIGYSTFFLMASFAASPAMLAMAQEPAIAQPPAVPVQPPDAQRQINGDIFAPADQNSYEAQLARKLHVEAAFLRRAVKLSAEQEEKLGAVTVKSLELNRINERRVAPGVEFQTRISVNGVPVIDSLQMRRLERAIDKTIDGLLTDEQRFAYKAEKEKRTAFERDVAVDGIMILLNKKLGLTELQRKTVRSKLTDWSEVGNVVVEYYLMKDYFPPIPAETIVPFLDEKQMKIFDSTSRTQIFHWPNPFVPGDVRIER